MVTQPHQLRAIDELTELSIKRKKLAVFISTSPAFKTLPTDEQTRLRRQFDIMLQYESVLQERINHFNEA